MADPPPWFPSLGGFREYIRPYGRRLRFRCGHPSCAPAAMFGRPADPGATESGPVQTGAAAIATPEPSNLAPTSPGRSASAAQCELPTQFGTFDFHVFPGGAGRQDVLVMVRGDVRGKRGVHTRVHDQCVTSEVFGSLKCDCKQQLEMAQQHICERATAGIIIYLQQEGRGIGLVAKVQAYHAQEQGYDTVDANRVLGLPDDARSYEEVPVILHALGVQSIALMTNNPMKIDALTELGVKIESRVPLVVDPAKLSPLAREYVETKVARMHHLTSAENSSERRGAKL